MNRVAYLMYHEIELPNRPLCDGDPGYVRYVVREETFRAQIDRLSADGVRGIAVRDALRERDAAAAPEARADRRRVAITFDDGCETDLLTAAPILRDAGFDATFYVTVDHLGRRGYLTKSQLRELADLGFEIGSHAMTHRYLHDLPDDEVQSELVCSKKELEDVTGQRVAQFSCPGGRWDRRVSQVARSAGYDSLVTSSIGMNSGRTNPFRLTRIAVMRGMDAPELARITRGKGLLRRRAQKTALDAAKRLLGNAMYERLRSAALRRKS